MALVRISVFIDAAKARLSKCLFIRKMDVQRTFPKTHKCKQWDDKAQWLHLHQEYISFPPGRQMTTSFCFIPVNISSLAVVVVPYTDIQTNISGHTTVGNRHLFCMFKVWSDRMFSWHLVVSGLLNTMLTNSALLSQWKVQRCGRKSMCNGNVSGYEDKSGTSAQMLWWT